MKSWRGVSLDPGSGGHWLENRALGWRMCSGGITHTPKDGGTQWEITALSLSVHLPAMERAQCVPLGLILSHQPPQKPPDPITGIRPGPRPWDGEPRNRPESTAHSPKITHTHAHIENKGTRRDTLEERKCRQKIETYFHLSSVFISSASSNTDSMDGWRDDKSQTKVRVEKLPYVTAGMPSFKNRAGDQDRKMRAEKYFSQIPHIPSLALPPSLSLSLSYSLPHWLLIVWEQVISSSALE